MRKNIVLFWSMFLGMIVLFSGCGGGDEDPTLSSIAVTTPATKLVYYVGDTTLDITDLVVTGTYSDGTTKAETVSLSNITGFDATTTGSKTLTITIGGKTTTYTIEVKIVEISSIAVTTPAIKTVYYEGDSTLDISGLVVTGTYNNGTTKAETVSIANISGFDTTTLGKKPLTITIGGKTTTYEIEVKEVVAVTAKKLTRSLDILNLKQYSISMDVFGNKANKIMFLDTNDVSPTEINVVSNKAETTELYVNLNINSIKIQVVDSEGNPLGSLKTVTLP